jgi:hypothetical protein
VLAGSCHGVGHGCAALPSSVELDRAWADAGGGPFAGAHHPLRSGKENTPEGGVYFVLYVFVLYFVLYLYLLAPATARVAALMHLCLVSWLYIWHLAMLNV